MALVGMKRHDEVERTPSVTDQVQRILPVGFSNPVAGQVLGDLQRAARALEGMPAG